MSIFIHNVTDITIRADAGRSPAMHVTTDAGVFLFVLHPKDGDVDDMLAGVEGIIPIAEGDEEAGSAMWMSFYDVDKVSADIRDGSTDITVTDGHTTHNLFLFH